MGQHNTYDRTKTGTWRRHFQTGNNCSLSLGRYVQMLPTPKASDGQHPGVKSHSSGQTLHLSAAVMPHTSTASDCQSLNSPTLCERLEALKAQGGSLNEEVQNLPKPTQSKARRRLNPIFVEAMMGFPTGWTQLEPLDQLANVTDSDDRPNQAPPGANKTNADYLLRHVDLEASLPCATDTDNIAHRRERLEALGNAVVPQQAAVAWERLAKLIETIEKSFLLSGDRKALLFDSSGGKSTTA